MTKKLVWRLGKLPDVGDLQMLIKESIITKEEAREILFNQEEDRDKESLKSEIKFLRELVEKLSNKSQIITTIKEIVPASTPYQYWYQPYQVWCGGIGTVGTITPCSGSYSLVTYTSSNFSDIKTF